MKTHTSVLLLAVLLTALAQAQGGLRSPDGRYRGETVGTPGDTHYRVVEDGTGRVVLTTHAKFATSNDVKRPGRFSKDSRRFAAAYHYAGPYTWIGVWSTESGAYLFSREKSGWTTEIADVLEEKVARQNGAGVQVPQ